MTLHLSGQGHIQDEAAILMFRRTSTTAVKLYIFARN